jgi:HrpA-like RNA helicase
VAGGFGRTPVGRRLARLPLHPRLGRMLLQAERWGCLERAALAAAWALAWAMAKRPVMVRASPAPSSSVCLSSL